MQKKTLTLRNAGPNGDSALDLYADAIGMLTDLAAQTDSLSKKEIAERIAQALAVLSELAPV